MAAYAAESMQGRVATGERAGAPAQRLRPEPSRAAPGLTLLKPNCGEHGGFNLHERGHIWRMVTGKPWVAYIYTPS